MSDSDYEGGEGVIDRKLVFCPSLQEFGIDELIKTCGDCHDFVLYCCSCSMKYRKTGRPCHHFRLIFTDGACRSNGQVGATAGIGTACGLNPGDQRSIPVTSLLDPGQKRTSQRVELLAALAGLQYMVEADRLNEPLAKKKKIGRKPDPKDPGKSWIIVTDSEYVVKGITEWLPTWKNNNLRNSSNKEPANLDLFLQLDAALTTEETKQDVKVGFWHVPRQYNRIADALAKQAAELGDPE